MPSDSGAKAVSAGATHTCAVLLDRSTVCWGAGEDGQLGYGSQLDSFSAAPVALPAPATAISAGSDHTCALLETGLAMCWGEGRSGQLGNGVEESTALPVYVSQSAVFTAITASTTNSGQVRLRVESLSSPSIHLSCPLERVLQEKGYGHSCAVRDDCSAVCWGSAAMGQLGQPPEVVPPLPPRALSLPPAALGVTKSPKTCEQLGREYGGSWSNPASADTSPAGAEPRGC